MTRARPAGVAAALLLTVLTGCGGGEEDQVDQKQAAEQRAEEARGYMDELAGMLGTDLKVQQDALADCVPGQDDSGLVLFYNVAYSTAPGAQERLAGEVRQEWESRGWTAEMKKPDDLKLTKAPFVIGATLSTDGTRGIVSGNGGCVK